MVCGFANWFRDAQQVAVGDGDVEVLFRPLIRRLASRPQPKCTWCGRGVARSYWLHGGALRRRSRQGFFQWRAADLRVFAPVVGEGAELNFGTPALRSPGNVEHLTISATWSQAAKFAWKQSLCIDFTDLFDL